MFIPGIGSFSKASELLLKNKEYVDFLDVSKKKSVIFGICFGECKFFLKKDMNSEKTKVYL